VDRKGKLKGSLFGYNKKQVNRVIKNFEGYIEESHKRENFLRDEIARLEKRLEGAQSTIQAIDQDIIRTKTLLELSRETATAILISADDLSTAKRLMVERDVELALQEEEMKVLELKEEQEDLRSEINSYRGKLQSLISKASELVLEGQDEPKLGTNENIANESIDEVVYDLNTSFYHGGEEDEEGSG